jgi:hypothetical protein
VAVPHAEARAAIDAVLAEHVQAGPVRVAADGTTYLFQLHGVSFSTITREYEGIGRVDLPGHAGGGTLSKASRDDWVARSEASR